LIFKLADVLGAHPYVLRLMATGFAFVTVAAAAYAGRIINGSRGAVVAGLVAASVGSMFAIDGFALTGECIAGTFVMISCALLLQAKYGPVRPQTGIVLTLCAAIVAALRFLLQQQFIAA